MLRYLDSVRDAGRKLHHLRGIYTAGDSRVIEEIRTQAHKLHGSGMTYGFPELSLAARRVEHATHQDLPEYLDLLIAKITRMDISGSVTGSDAGKDNDKLRALIVDDNVLNANNIKNSLQTIKDVGECIVAHTAVAACDELVKGNIHLLILDLMLPDGDGREILRDLKEVLGIDLPTLVMSGVINDALYLECMQLGALGYLSKPFDTDRLIPEIERLVKESRLQQRKPVAGKKPDAVPPASSEAIPGLDGYRILVAEDDPLQADLVVHCLERTGAKVRVCSDGESAMSVLNNHKFNIAILDVNMPVMNGFTLLRYIRSRPDMAKMPVIMLTAMGKKEDIIRGYELGANDYILKPFSEPQLYARVTTLLNRKS